MGMDVPADTTPDTPDDADGGSPCEPQPSPAEFDLTELSVNGSRVLVARPEGRIQGVMLLIHGTGGDARVYYDRVEAALFAHAALQRGMLLVAPESITRGRGAAWELELDGADMANVVATVERVQELGVPENTPLYLVGGSNGGNMVAAIAQVLDPVSVHIFISRARAYTEEGTRVPPTFFVEGRNDSTLPREAPNAPLPFEVYERVVRQGATAEHRYNEPAPVTPGRFTRLRNFTCPQSIAVYRALKGHDGVLDEDDMLVEEWQSSGWMRALPPMAEPHANDIGDQLKELYGEHVPTADFNTEVLDFMLAQ